MPRKAFLKILSINEEWRVQSDRYSWHLQRKIITEKNPDGVWTVIGHYPKLTQCLESLFEQEYREADSIKALFAKIEELKQLVLSLNFDEKVEK